MPAPLRRSFEEAMIQFVARWYPYGGGPQQQILEEFGLAESAFFGRVLDLIEYVPDLDPAVRDRLRSICRRRLDEATN